MFSTAWVSAVTLFSVCLSAGLVCALRFFPFRSCAGGAVSGQPSAGGACWTKSVHCKNTQRKCAAQKEAFAVAWENPCYELAASQNLRGTEALTKKRNLTNFTTANCFTVFRNCKNLGIELCVLWAKLNKVFSPGEVRMAIQNWPREKVDRHKLCEYWGKKRRSLLLFPSKPR